MVRRFGPLLSVLGLRRRLRHVNLLDASVDHVRDAAARGPIAYVLLHRTRVDHLALNAALNHRDLPLAVWANGVSTLWIRRLSEMIRDGWSWLTEGRRAEHEANPIGSGWLAAEVLRAPVVVFLTRRGREFREVQGPDPLQALLDAQARSERPISLLPVVVVWDRSPQAPVDPVRRFLLGSREYPSLFTRLRNVFTRYRTAWIQVGEPLDLTAFRARVHEARQLATLRVLLRRHLKRESKLVRGPELLPQRDMQRLVLDNPPMRAAARQIAERERRSYDDVRAEQVREFHSIAAHFRWWVAMLAHVVLQPLWTKVFSGVDVRDEDIETIRAAMRDGAVVLVPCHKSHFDYVLLSWVFYDNHLIVPHVVAGLNLAMPVVSFFLRSLGGFFIKRSFAGEAVHPMVFARYLRELLRHEYPVEFFIEGGRTRSGRLLRPKVGVLGMVVEGAEVRRRGREVTILPMGLCYQQVAEERSFARELGGERKRPESLGQVARASSVFGRRFGRVYLRVGEPIPCSAIVDSEVWAAAGPDARHDELQRLGDRIVHRIGEVLVTLPSSLVAMALLAHHRRGIAEVPLKDRIERFRAFLARAGAEEAATLHRFDEAIGAALQRFLRQHLVTALDHEGARVWAVDPDARIPLAYYRDHCMHRFAAASLAAAATRGLPPGSPGVDDLLPGFDALTGLLEREWIRDPDESVRAALERGLADLEAHGAIAPDAGGWRVNDPDRIGEIYTLTRPLLESYIVTMRTVLQGSPGVSRRELPKWLQDHVHVTWPEARSLVNLQNATNTLFDLHILHEVAGAVEATSAAEHWIARLAPMVDG